ncbi:MAG TPA: hypothetical protein VFV87_08625 [Pirellulaceae bacterium]|nr:hypothetical protein [Pirellulaceae bacterium]
MEHACLVVHTVTFARWWRLKGTRYEVADESLSSFVFPDLLGTP